VAGTTTYTKTQLIEGVEVHKWSWTADASTGAIASGASTGEVHGYVVLFKTDPGGTAPTASYDVTVTDPEGCDVLGGEGSDRSATAIEQGFPLVGNAYVARRVDGVLTFNGSGNSVNSATGDFYLIVERN
jgi:hypothetical protein